MELLVNFDGACEPVNPGGTASWGFVITGPIDHAEGGVIGTGRDMTNNLAEYTALGKALRFLLDEFPAVTGLSITESDRAIFRGDSKLVVEQVAGRWRCNAPHLVRLRDRCRELLSQLSCAWSLAWVPREENTRADEMSVRAWCQSTGRSFPERRRK